mmetsp:Transcript_13704/g.20923  ORF Transcript_13704/g.20923 Transcript_13704/m.20923 type:complete len:256 (+) Transcript_13704:242-1009(+)
MTSKKCYNPYKIPSEGVHFEMCAKSRQLDALLRQQIGYAEALKEYDIDIFYSRTDLRMLVDQRREMTRKLLLSDYYPMQNCDQFLFHAAIYYNLNARNLRQLLTDYRGFDPELINVNLHHGASPVHLLAASSSYLGHQDQMDRFNEVLKGNEASFCRACGMEDSFGFVPLVVAIISGMRLEVVDAVLDLFPAAVAMAYIPTALAKSEDAHELAGLFPWQIACCCDNSVDVIYSLLRADASRVQSGATMFTGSDAE